MTDVTVRALLIQREAIEEGWVNRTPYANGEACLVMRRAKGRTYFLPPDACHVLRMFVDSPSEWNDASGRKKEEAIAIMDVAIVHAQGISRPRGF